MTNREEPPVIVNVVVNHNDNRNVEMLVDGAENCSFTQTVEVENSNSSLALDTSTAPPVRNQLQIERTIQEVFGFEDRSWSYMQSSQFDDAFAVLKRKFDLGKDLSRARDLVVYYVVAVRARHPEKASEIRREIFILLRNNTPATGKDAKYFANLLLKDSKYLEAILFFLLSADYYATEGNGRFSAYGVLNCGHKIMLAVRAMLRGSEDSKTIVKIQILPLFEEFRAKIQTIPDVDDEIRIVCDVHCLNCAALALTSVGEFQHSEQTCRRALDALTQKVPASYARYHLHADLLECVATNLFRSERFSDAAEYYSRALYAYMSAEWNEEYLLHTEELEVESAKRNQVEYVKGCLKTVNDRLKV